MKKNSNKKELNKVSGGISKQELLQAAETHNILIKKFGITKANEFLDNMVQFSCYEKELIRDKASQLRQTIK